ncbi:Receptor-type tyrosine-protein phosphatase delta [Oopsacas minuta]|uniref:protein-tyrosine-phosphatase n=1 Tax=Oopsacas minuta TaxID=111878 RepID=A0AAV7KG62_9METZ|nr:Receptor-type tyrosine-protein phosphatase delta [Oopsacas minuta]
MQTSADFSLLSLPVAEITPAIPDSPIGIVVALVLIIVVLAIVIVVLVILIVWYMRRRKNKPISQRHSSISGKIKPSGSGKEGNVAEITNPLLPPPVIMKSTISLTSFAKYVESMGANDRLKFHEEYMSIKDPPHTHDMCSMSANGPRNRYRDIRTYDHSRVAITIIDPDEYSDYINANFIHGYYKKNEYIAAQGPLDNTIADFWRMTWDWNVPTIVMLTKCVERGRRKCSQYWPDKGTTTYSFYDSTGSSREFVDATVERETTYAHYIIREIVITRVDVPNQQKRLTQWHYTSWPDMGVPENGTSLLKFVQKVHQAHPRDSGPMIVHCSAGVGRTGTFITLGCMMPMIREQSLVDVYNFVNRMRDSRNRMVQVEAQYVFIHEALLEFIQHGDTEVSGEDLDTYFRSLDMEEESGVSKLLGQFKRLAYPVRPTEYSIAQSAQNKAKNRYVNILPYNHKRVKLTPVPGVENSDYINASYIDGYWIKNAFIATQGPLQGTIEDFWKMIWEQHANTIVMLTSEVEAGRERCVHYWPEEQPEYYGPIMVELLDTKLDEENEFIVHELKVTQTKENRTRKLKHFQYTGWHEREMPDTTKGLNKMIADIEQWTRSTNPTHPIVVHCSAGVGRTGVFVGVYNMMESIRHENTVDVFNSVRMMRYQRPAMVQTATQYRFCYLALVDYISSESNSVYQNVPKM